MLNTILAQVGNTPVIQLQLDCLHNMEVMAKLEFYNPTGSIKDRAAKYLIEKLISKREINHSTVVIESSSGNFGIALSAYCKKYNIPFYCVIDPLITPINEMIIRSLSSKVFKVTERDENGGYLLNRIRTVNELVEAIPNSYWVNQYENPYNAEAYYATLGEEICRSHPDIDYLFVGVSSGGTITGLSKKIKEEIPSCKIIAVDVEGSVVFGGKAKRRFIPGIGSSMRPRILEQAHIDEIVYAEELVSVYECRELLTRHHIFAGGSSGSVIAAVKKYFRFRTNVTPTKVMTLFCDRGDRYASTIYNDDWLRESFPNSILS
ncbi:2,3-diaminopropionate biosynthesis protein SbnA [Cohnella soli]|uniref:N-(2-amino-2-carboxyethyl)-L-glutamate synthase n=1 Tax=Cohnella soli TaxID=425005 RepID=A0ABW0HVM9_9BACL